MPLVLMHVHVFINNSMFTQHVIYPKTQDFCFFIVGSMSKLSHLMRDWPWVFNDVCIYKQF